MKKLWFKCKTYGWGWTPATWEGYLVMFGYLAIALFLLARSQSMVQFHDVLWQFIVPFVLATILLIMICVKTGEKPKWQWGKKKNLPK